MSYEATRLAWNVFANHQGLAATRRIVLLALAECHNKETGRCDPSTDHLHKMTGLKVQTIVNGIRDLESEGLITVDRAFGKSSVYRLTYAENGTTAEMGTTAENGITPMPKTAEPPMPKTAYKPGNEPGRNQEQSTTTSGARASQTEDKQPGGASLGGQGRHEGEPAKPVERSKTKRTIPDDWQPGKRCLELLEQAGIEAGFALGLVGEFCLYWQERGDKRPGWDATFLNHVKAQWMREEERHKGGTNVTPLRPVPSGHRNGSGNFRTFEQMRADNTQRAIDEFLFGDNVGAVIDA